MALWVGLVAVVGTSGCLSREEYAAMVEAARTCEPTDTCVLTRHDVAVSCDCPVPVRASEVANIEAAARSLACGGVTAKCVPWTETNLRCEAGRCVSDQ